MLFFGGLMAPVALFLILVHTMYEVSCFWDVVGELANIRACGDLFSVGCVLLVSALESEIARMAPRTSRRQKYPYIQGGLIPAPAVGVQMLALTL